MSNSAIPDLISEDIFRFGPGDRYALPIGTAAPDALALSQMAEKCRTRHERLLVICADPLDAVRLGQEIPWFSPELGVRSRRTFPSRAFPTGRRSPTTCSPRRRTSSPSALRPSTA